MLLTIAAAYLFADFLSGVAHWLEDRYFMPDWPWIGKHISAPNELHHADQTAFLAGSYWHRNWTTILPAGAGALLAFLCGAPLWLVLAFVFASQGAQVHTWAHRRPKWRVVRGLQEFGVLQSARQHAEHHRAPHSCNYCAMTDFLNPVLERLQFWTAAEAVLRWAFGWKVKAASS